MTELITHNTSSLSGIATEHDIRAITRWGLGDQLNVSVNTPIERTLNHLDFISDVGYEWTTKIDVGVGTSTGNFISVDTTHGTRLLTIEPVDIHVSEGTPNDFDWVDSPCASNYVNILPYLDMLHTDNYHAVNVYADKPNPPIDYSNLKTPLSPVDMSSELNWNGLGEMLTFSKEITYGYSINAFVVSGGSNTTFKTDEDALEPEPEIPTTGEVVRIVNIVNVVALPSRTPINFTNLSLAIDLDSIAWVANFDIADQASLDLIKPSGLTSKEVEININGELYIVFIGRTNTSVTGDRDKGTKRRIRCTGWSKTKQLSYPYSPKRSHTETSSSTPAGLLTDELTGTGFTGVWGSPSWTVPPNIFSYFEKAPLAAISELAQAIGSVIVPSMAGDSLTVKPYYPISPWNWDTATPDFTLNETEFFSIDTEWIPQESPDSIYIYGEESGGVAVKCVKSGSGAVKTLPTIVDKYITDTVAGTERGRTEIAKNGFKEVIPITTYVGVNGIIKPHSLLEINGLDGGVWRGMVVGTSIGITRNGNAVVQTLQIERHYVS